MYKKVTLVLLALVLSFFLLALADLIPFWMPMMGEMIALLVVTVLLLAWAGFIVSESAADEREVYITMQSGRLAYVAGLLTLVVALVLQGLAHTIDPWIPVTLAVMVVAKLLGRIYFDR
jgi:hypothetical protein